MIVSIEDNGSLYYPKIISANTSATFPFTHKIANIVAAKSGLDHIKNDDIVRIKNLFDGRIINIDYDFNTVMIQCRSHSQEFNHRFVTQDYTQVGTTSGDTLESLIDTYLERISAGTMQGNVISNFDLSANKRNIFDVIKRLELLDPDHRIVEDAQYTDDILSDYIVNWKKLPTVPILDVRTSRAVKSYRFSNAGRTIYNRVYIFGNSVDGVQYSGFAEDAASITKYDPREFIYCDTSLDNNVLCTNIAQGIIDNNSTNIINGTIVLEGTLIEPGDLITCDLPIYIEEEKMQGNYRVTTVKHTLNPWMTTLTIGEHTPTPMDLIAGMVSKARLDNLNSVL